MEAYQEVSESLRKSSYLNMLPPLEVECVEFDGDLNTLPIFYEEQYQEMVRRDSNNSHSSRKFWLVTKFASVLMFKNVISSICGIIVFSKEC